MTRLGIVLMFALLLVLAGGLASIPLVVRDPLRVLGPQSPITVEQADSELPLVARLEVDPQGRFIMLFAIRQQAEGDVPRLVLSMPDHEMAPIEATVDAMGGNRFRATASNLTTPGRWHVSLDQDGAEHAFQFILRE